MRNLIAIFGLVLSCLGCSNEQATNQDQNEVLPHQNKPTRVINNNILVSSDLPPIEIQVADEFTYIGQFDFEIIANSDEYPPEMQGKAVAAGDRFVFAAADENKNVDKLFLVQLEGFLPDNDFIYNYSFDTAEQIGENKYRHNTWIYDSAEGARENPNNEGAKTRTFLAENGYQLEDQFMMSRYVGLASEDRKHEIIIYYIEMLNKTTGYTLEEYENTISKKERESILEGLVNRSRNSFKIIKG